jgi:VanZ family protein
MTARIRPITALVRPWPSVIAWMVVVFVGSSIPLPEGPEVDFPVGPDKIAHCFAYALLAALGVRARWRPGRSVLRVGAVVLGAIAFGALIEGWQGLVVHRGCELGDGIANAVGAVVGSALAVGAYLEHGGRHGRKERTGHGEGQHPNTH